MDNAEMQQIFLQISSVSSANDYSITAPIAPITFPPEELNNSN